MKKIIFGIFAHPDDEAFGPSGTLIKEVAEGTELHLIVLTVGQNGTNPDHYANLGEIRRSEWLVSGALLGATSQHELGYIDGHLCNTEMIEAAERIEKLVSEIITDREVEIDFMSFDLNGLTGHIDHIATTRAVCLAFYRLKANDDRFKQIRLFCLPESQAGTVNADWIYMEAGRKPNEVNEVIDAREYHDKIIEVIHAHNSQRGDGDTHIKNNGVDLGLDHFIILK